MLPSTTYTRIILELNSLKQVAAPSGAATCYDFFICDHRSQATSAMVSTWMGTHLGTPGVDPSSSMEGERDIPSTKRRLRRNLRKMVIAPRSSHRKPELGAGTSTTMTHVDWGVRQKKAKVATQSATGRADPLSWRGVTKKIYIYKVWALQRHRIRL